MEEGNVDNHKFSINIYLYRKISRILGYKTETYVAAMIFTKFSH